MDHKEIIDVYLADIRIRLDQLLSTDFNEWEVSEVINHAYAKMKEHFDKHFLSTLSEDEIEDFFETIDLKTNNLIDSITPSKKA